MQKNFIHGDNLQDEEKKVLRFITWNMSSTGSARTWAYYYKQVHLRRRLSSNIVRAAKLAERTFCSTQHSHFAKLHMHIEATCAYRKMMRDFFISIMGIDCVWLELVVYLKVRIEQGMHHTWKEIDPLLATR